MRIDDSGNIEYAVPDCKNNIHVKENGDFRRACCEISNEKECKKDSLFQIDQKIAKEAKEEAKKKAKETKKAKKGGSINLTKEQAKELIKQIGGNSIKSTYITYNGKDAKILGYNKYIREFILQTNSGLENISIKNLLVNGKHVL